MTPTVIYGMGGLGDNFHQRAIVREIMQQGGEVYLESPFAELYYDLRERGLKILRLNIPTLRTVCKNVEREAHLFYRGPVPANPRRVRVNYPPAQVRASRSVLAAICAVTGCSYEKADFSLPIAPAWAAKAKALIEQWRPDKPLLIYRPLVERPKDWTGCPARNPDYEAYATLFNKIAKDFFVVSVADLVAGHEWPVGIECRADVICHQGEIEYEVLAAVMREAALVYTSPGFAVVMAQAVGTPVVCVFGGYERAYSFSGGARHSPYLGIEPKNPCDCFSHQHNCRKEIDLGSAREEIARFARTSLNRSGEA